MIPWTLPMASGNRGVTLVSTRPRVPAVAAPIISLITRWAPRLPPGTVRLAYRSLPLTRSRPR